MDVAAGTGSNGSQEIPHDDGIGVGAADPPGRLGCDPAGAVGAQTAAYALEAEAAFGTLALYTVVGCFHGKPGNEAF